MIVVMANGCFDLLHAGHVAHLEEARKMGDMLMVSLTTDGHINKGNGRPVFKWDERAAVLRGLRAVDVVVPTDEAEHAILQYKPDIFVKGVDYVQTGLKEEVMDACKQTGTVLKFTGSHKMSSSDAIKRIMDSAPEWPPMYNYTLKSVPPKHEVLAVVHKLSSRGEYADDEAIWDGEMWTRRRDGERMDLNYYYLWRKLET